jgi:ABC-type multidrug transport system ATPase subunit
MLRATSTRQSADEIEQIVKRKLEMVGLTGFENLKPAEISGGMKKRVGLARALALDPELLFSDEPTSGLDPIMTAVVDQLTLKLTHGSHMTAVVVSHDMTSAFRIATRMIMLGHGSIVAQGTPEEIRTSTNPEVHQFINGEADGPIPLNLSQDEHEHHQHVKPRPFLSARYRFHHKTPETKSFRHIVACRDLDQLGPPRGTYDRANRLPLKKTDPHVTDQLRRRYRH